jgi:hypothetical protein
VIAHPDLRQAGTALPGRNRARALAADRHPARDVLFVVALKLLLLGALSQLFFSASHRPRVNADTVARHLLTDGAAR